MTVFFSTIAPPATARGDDAWSSFHTKENGGGGSQGAARGGGFRR